VFALLRSAKSAFQPKADLGETHFRCVQRMMTPRPILLSLRGCVVFLSGDLSSDNKLCRKFTNCICGERCQASCLQVCRCDSRCYFAFLNVVSRCDAHRKINHSTMPE
jgi:ABC-type transporter Mla MlaB component